MQHIMQWYKTHTSIQIIEKGREKNDREYIFLDMQKHEWNDESKALITDTEKG